MTGGHSDGDSEIVRVPFDSQFLEPVVRGDKDTTLRIERYDIEAGDHIILTNETGKVEWARAEVQYTFTVTAAAAPELLERLGVNHSLTNTEKNAVEVLQPHYSTPVTPTDTVQGIHWNVVNRFAQPPEVTTLTDTQND